MRFPSAEQTDAGAELKVPVPIGAHAMFQEDAPFVEKAHQILSSVPLANAATSLPSAEQVAAGDDVKVPGAIGAHAMSHESPPLVENAHQMLLSVPLPKTITLTPA